MPPEGGEDEEDIFPGIEKLFEPYEHEEAAEEPQPAPPQAPQPEASAGSEALEPIGGLHCHSRVKKFHERLLPLNECWKNCAMKWSFTSCM